jgi:hypothetical protein
MRDRVVVRVNGSGRGKGNHSTVRHLSRRCKRYYVLLLVLPLSTLLLLSLILSSILPDASIDLLSKTTSTAYSNQYQPHEYGTASSSAVGDLKLKHDALYSASANEHNAGSKTEGRLFSSSKRQVGILWEVDSALLAAYSCSSSSLQRSDIGRHISHILRLEEFIPYRVAIYVKSIHTERDRDSTGTGTGIMLHEFKDAHLARTRTSTSTSECMKNRSFHGDALIDGLSTIRIDKWLESVEGVILMKSVDYADFNTLSHEAYSYGYDTQHEHEYQSHILYRLVQLHSMDHYSVPIISSAAGVLSNSIMVHADKLCLQHSDIYRDLLLDHIDRDRICYLTHRPSVHMDMDYFRSLPPAWPWHPTSASAAASASQMPVQKAPYAWSSSTADAYAYADADAYYYLLLCHVREVAPCVDFISEYYWPRFQHTAATTTGIEVRSVLWVLVAECSQPKLAKALASRNLDPVGHMRILEPRIKRQAIIQLASAMHGMLLETFPVRSSRLYMFTHTIFTTIILLLLLLFSLHCTVRSSDLHHSYHIMSYHINSSLNVG